MKDDEKCKIVLDLLPNYVENLLSFESKQFVEEHLKTCQKCQNIFQTIKRENIKNDSFLENESINIFKKYNMKLNIFRAIVFAGVISILTLGSIFAFHQYEGQIIINKIADKEKELLEKDNYCITGKMIHINHKNTEREAFVRKTYIKDSKYKIELKLDTEFYYQNYRYMDNEQDFTSVEYGTFDSKESIFVFPNTKTATKQFSNNPAHIRKKQDLSFFVSNSYLNFPTMFFRKDKYMGRECYVKKFSGDSTAYYEIWIDIETLFPIRTIEEKYNTYYRESTNAIEYNNVTDEDVNFNEEGYTIEEIEIPPIDNILNTIN